MVQLPGCVRCRLGACEESHLVERKPLSSAAFPCCSRLSARPESRRWALITQNVETLWSGSRTGFYFCEQGNWDRSELAFVARLKHWRGGNRLWIISTIGNKQTSKTKCNGGEIAHIGNGLSEVTRNQLLGKFMKMSAR